MVATENECHGRTYLFVRYCKAVGYIEKILIGLTEAEGTGS